MSGLFRVQSTLVVAGGSRHGKTWFRQLYVQEEYVKEEEERSWEDVRIGGWWG